MLPAVHRLRRPAQFRAVLRGRRAGRTSGELFVLHAARTDRLDGETSSPRAGFVVSKAIGDAPARSRAKRLLRHVVAGHLAEVPSGVDLVLRAHPAMAGASYVDVDRAFERQLRVALARLR